MGAKQTPKFQRWTSILGQIRFCGAIATGFVSSSSSDASPYAFTPTGHRLRFSEASAICPLLLSSFLHSWIFSTARDNFHGDATELIN
jgi:hypothetical protein